jgi:LysR family transcriptional regulator, regulator of gene expression of beta-lactamase
MAERHTTLPPLTWLRAFESAARHLSFTAAAVEIGLTQAAVSQQIRLLEFHLKVSLFRRLRRGVELTAEGAAFLPHVQSGFGLIARSTRELFGSRSEGRVRVVSPISFACLWLAPLLKSFNEARPNISIELSTIHLPQDYQMQEAELEIRFGERPFPGREAVQLTVEKLVPVAAPLLVQNLRGGSWTKLPRLSLSGGREMWSQWFEAAGIKAEEGPSHRFDSFIAALSAAIAGAGVLLGSRPLVDEALAAGRLERLSRIEIDSVRGHFVTYAEVGRLSPPAQDFLTWLMTVADKAGSSQMAGG